MCFITSLALLSFSQTYSQILLGVALPFFIIDTSILRRFTLSEFEKTLYSLIALFLALEIVAALSNATPLKSLWMLREEGLFLLIPMSLRAFRDDQFRLPILKTIMFSALALALYGVVQHYTGVTIFHPGQELYQSNDGLYITLGNFHNSLTFGNFMAVSAMFILPLGVFSSGRSSKALFLLSGAIASIVVFFSYQRGSVLGLFVGAIVFLIICFPRRRTLVAVLFGAILVTGALLSPRIVDRLKESFQREIASGEISDRDYSLRRTTIWKTSLAIVADNPLLGVGCGNFESAYKRYADSSVVLSFSHAHNDALNFAACSGVPTLLAYVLMWFFLLRALIQNRRRKNLAPDVQMAISATLVASITFLTVSLTEVAFTKEVVRSAIVIFWGYGLWGLEQSGIRSIAKLNPAATSDNDIVHSR